MTVGLPWFYGIRGSSGCMGSFPKCEANVVEGGELSLLRKHLLSISRYELKIAELDEIRCFIATENVVSHCNCLLRHIQHTTVELISIFV